MKSENSVIKNASISWASCCSEPIATRTRQRSAELMPLRIAQTMTQRLITLSVHMMLFIKQNRISFQNSTQDKCYSERHFMKGVLLVSFIIRLIAANTKGN